MSQTVVVQTPGSTVVQGTQARTVVVTRGVPGVRGLEGPAGPEGGTTTLPVAAPLGGHSVVAANAQGALVPADCTLPAHLGAVLGVVANAYTPGEAAAVQIAYLLEHVGWSWATGPVYVGVAGALTQALPPGALFCQVVGFALSATRVLVDLQPPIQLT